MLKQYKSKEIHINWNYTVQVQKVVWNRRKNVRLTERFQAKNKFFYTS